METQFWQIVCEFHKRNPLGKTLRCSCRILKGDLAKAARLRFLLCSKAKIPLVGPEFSKTVFYFPKSFDSSKTFSQNFERELNVTQRNK